MKREYRAGILILAGVLIMSGCGSNKREEYRLSGIGQMQNGDYAAALVSFEQALAASKGSVSDFELDVLKYRAEAEYLLEDYEAAAHTYDVLLQVDEENVNYRLYRTMALAGSGALGEAIEEYRKARTMLGETPDEKDRDRLIAVVQNLGTILENEPDYRDAALLLYQELSDAGFHSAELYNRMGRNRMEAKDYDGAIRLFEQGISAGDTQAVKELRYNQAAAYEFKADYKRALELFEAYKAEYGDDEEVAKEINFLRTR